MYCMAKVTNVRMWVLFNVYYYPETQCNLNLVEDDQYKVESSYHLKAPGGSLHDVVTNMV